MNLLHGAGVALGILSASAAFAGQNLANPESQAPGAQPAAGFETMAPQGEKPSDKFRTLAKGERASKVETGFLQPRYFSTGDLSALASHDIWPMQAWTLVNTMPWPPGEVELLALKPLPVIRVTDPTLTATIPAKAAGTNAPPPPPSQGQGNDPVQPGGKPATNADGVPASAPAPESQRGAPPPAKN